MNREKTVSNRTMQKNLLRHRLWVLALSLLIFFIYYVGYIALALSGMRAGIGSRATAGESLPPQVLILFTTDGRAVTAVITVALAILTCMEGFFWVDQKNQLTFYESLPVSRARHFWNIVINSFVIYIVPYLLMMVIGLLLAFGFGGGSGKLVQGTFLLFVRNIFLFFAVYASSVLAVILTGNIIVALLAEGVFLGFEPLLDQILEGCRSTMFRTYVTPASVWTHFFSPLTSVLASVSAGRGVLLNLAGGLVFLSLAFLVYMRFRQNEDAGKAVLFKPVQQIAKIAVSFVISLAVGLIAYSAAGNSMAAAIISIVIAAFVIGGIMEVIYHYNIRNMFSRLPSVLAAAGISILVLSCYRFDVTRFDRWTPDPSEVASAYLFDDDHYYTNHYTDEGGLIQKTENYYRKYMYLTDIKSVNDVLAAGEKTTARVQSDRYSYSSLLISYRMKNGKTVKRSIALRADRANSALMDEVIGSEKFHEGYFQLYHDGFIENNLKKGELSYWNGSDLSNPLSVKAEKTYAAFKKAYLKDLQSFNYTLASKGLPVGKLSVQGQFLPKRSYYTINYPVYASFSNTISFLKANGLYQEPVDPKSLNSRFRGNLITELAGPFSTCE